MSDEHDKSISNLARLESVCPCNISTHYVPFVHDVQEKINVQENNIHDKNNIHIYTDENCIYDFINNKPRTDATYTGSGVVMRYVYDDIITYYVVTCNHCVIKHSVYHASNNGICVELNVEKRFPEIDIAIMSIKSDIDIENFTRYDGIEYYDETMAEKMVLCDSLNDVTLHNVIQYDHKYGYLMSNAMGVLSYYVVDIEDDECMDRHGLSGSVTVKLEKLSNMIFEPTSIIVINAVIKGNNVMCALDFEIVNNTVMSYLMNGTDALHTISFPYAETTIGLKHDDFLNIGAIGSMLLERVNNIESYPNTTTGIEIKGRSVRYRNGGNNYVFDKGDYIMEIDGYALNTVNPGVIVPSKTIGHMEFNMYIITKYLHNVNCEVTMGIGKVDANGKVRYSTYSLAPKSINDICKPYHNFEVVWRNMVFIEWNEQFGRYYKINGKKNDIFIVNWKGKSSVNIMGNPKNFTPVQIVKFSKRNIDCIDTLIDCMHSANNKKKITLGRANGKKIKV